MPVFSQLQKFECPEENWVSGEANGEWKSLMKGMTLLLKGFPVSNNCLGIAIIKWKKTKRGYV